MAAMVAVVWHYWIGVFLVLFAVVPAVVLLVGGYLKKVQSIRYPKQD
jgi:hypothetical protein